MLLGFLSCIVVQVVVYHVLNKITCKWIVIKRREEEADRYSIKMHQSSRHVELSSYRHQTDT